VLSVERKIRVKRKKMNLRDVYFVIINKFVMTIVKFISDDFHRRATQSTYDLKSDLSVSKSLNIESSSIIDYMVTDIIRTSSLGTIYVLDILYNYHPCSRGDKKGDNWYIISNMFGSDTK
jgi:hypothetical protein